MNPLENKMNVLWLIMYVMNWVVFAMAMWSDQYLAAIAFAVLLVVFQLERIAQILIEKFGVENEPTN
jgi:hypothetical protein